ncbi:hypothetical protein M23134_06722 [Microscilla marina ATCC 23134]|uniref:Uncharacterized protein n=1 Tax=Microscilla marina ATCC 23134 TaxID=313606 RepID=A1ZXQ2_MICM2|nr:hypothetical protein M23134_06722 [Microscilla marina ATCC 23134]
MVREAGLFNTKATDFRHLLLEACPLKLESYKNYHPKEI